MTTNKFANCFILTITLMFLSCFSGTIYAEQLLEKGDSEYYGWAESGEKFRTCSQNVIEIGDGKVSDTSTKCNKTQRLLENERREKFGLPLLIIDDVKTVKPIKTFEDYMEALTKRDTTSMSRLLANSFTNITSGGSVTDKTTFLESYSKPVLPDTEKVEAVKIIEQKVKMLGKTAVIITLVELRGKSSTGEDSIQNVLFNTTVVKKDRRWQIVSMQRSEIMQPKLQYIETLKPKQ